MEKCHDAIRGKGTFARLQKNLECLSLNGIPVTLSVAVNSGNIADLPAIIDFAAETDIHNIHLLYHFIRGKGNSSQFIPAEELFPHLAKAQIQAESVGITIDSSSFSLTSIHLTIWRKKKVLFVIFSPNPKERIVGRNSSAGGLYWLLARLFQQLLYSGLDSYGLDN